MAQSPSLANNLSLAASLKRGVSFEQLAWTVATFLFGDDVYELNRQRIENIKAAISENSDNNDGVNSIDHRIDPFGYAKLSAYALLADNIMVAIIDRNDAKNQLENDADLLSIEGEFWLDMDEIGNDFGGDAKVPARYLRRWKSLEEPLNEYSLNSPSLLEVNLESLRFRGRLNRLLAALDEYHAEKIFNLDKDRKWTTFNWDEFIAAAWRAVFYQFNEGKSEKLRQQVIVDKVLSYTIANGWKPPSQPQLRKVIQRVFEQMKLQNDPLRDDNPVMFDRFE